MIQARRLTKKYDNGVLALENLSLHIKKGEFVFLVGPSGAGKSTFLNLVIRRETPTDGFLSVAGRNVALLKKQEIPFFRRRIGYIFQDYKLFPNKTVRENVSFALEVIEVDPGEIRKRVNFVLDLVGLIHKAEVFPSELSGGTAAGFLARPSLTGRCSWRMSPPGTLIGYFLGDYGASPGD